MIKKEKKDYSMYYRTEADLVRDAMKKIYLNSLYGTLSFEKKYFNHQDISEWVKEKKEKNMLTIKNVIFNKPATIVFWKDGTKTVVKCGENDTYDPEKGLAMAIVKRTFGNEGNYYNKIKEWLPVDYVPADISTEVRKRCSTCKHYLNSVSQDPCESCIESDELHKYWEPRDKK